MRKGICCGKRTKRARKAMADPFELWRMVWSSAVAQGVERFVDSFVPSTALAHPRPAELDRSAFATVGRVRIELSTMLLLEQLEPAPSKTSPVLIVAPYAVHDASIADFAEGHSIAMALAEGGPHRLALTFWKSATAEMRDFGIDAYLADLNVAVDDLGGRASLIGLCQGGWLAAAYAARFPKKVRSWCWLARRSIPAPQNPASPRLSLRFRRRRSNRWSRSAAAGSPGHCHSPSGRTAYRRSSPRKRRCNAASTPRSWRSSTCGTSGQSTCRAPISCRQPNGSFARTALRAAPFQRSGAPPRSPPSKRRFLAAADDEVVSLPQATAAKSLCRRTRVKIRIAPGRHLSLFMGRRTVGGVWRDIAQWLGGTGARAAPGLKRSRKRG
jgi:poly(3-hydroxybutyrate) depolymerase